MNTLATVVQGSIRAVLAQTWTNEDGTALNLTTATITGKMKDSTGNPARAITGTLAITEAANGMFTWTLSAADVATPGNYEVQFIATFASGATPAKRRPAIMVIEPSI